MVEAHRDPGPGFAGRREELDRLRRLWPTRRSGGRFAVVSGVGGIGKTRLLHEALDGVGDGCRIARSRCQQRPVGALDVVVSLAEQLGLSSFAEALSPTHTSPDPLPVTAFDHDRSRRLAGISSLADQMVASAEAVPTIVVIDDLHWCHPEALTFLEALTDEIERHLRDSDLLVVVASRPTPIGHEVGQFIGRVGRLPHCTTIELEGLSRDDEARLVRRLDPQASPALLSLVRRSANGNPLHVAATLSVAQQRQIDEPSVEFDARLLGRIAMSIDATDPVTAWLLALPDHLIETLSTCAVLDDEFLASDVVALSLRTDGQTRSALDAVTRAGVLGTDGVTFWFAHSHYRDVLYGRLSPSDRAEIHARCAELIGTRATRTARHDIAIGNHLLSVPQTVSTDRAESFLRAGTASIQQSSWGEAARYLEAALNSHEGDGESVPSDLYLLAGRAHYFNHHPTAAERHLRTALTRAHDEGDEATHCAALVHLMWCKNSMYSSAMHRPVDRSLVDEFLASAVDPLLRSRALEVLAEAQIAVGDTELGKATATAALSSALEAGDGRAIAFARFAIGYASLAANEIHIALDEIGRAAAKAAEVGDWYLESGINARLAFALLAAGDLDRADDTAGKAIDAARRQTEYSGQALAGVVRSTVAAIRGDFRLATHCLEQASALNDRARHNAGSMFLAPLDVALSLAQGLSPAALDALDRHMDVPRTISASLRDVIDATVGAAGRSERLHVPTQLTMAAAVGLAAQTEAALRRSDSETLSELHPALRRLDELGVVVPPGFPVLVSRLLGDLEAALGNDEEAAAAWARAETVAKRTQMYPELARVLLSSAIAESDREGGSRERTRQHATDAVELAQRLGMPDVLARATDVLRNAIDSAAAIQARGGDWRVILSSDVAGSTSISYRLGDFVYHDVITDHHQLVRDVGATYGGMEFSDSGDGLMLWFDETSAAVGAAYEIQRRARSGRLSTHLAVKVGLAGGEPLFRDSRPFGLVVNRAARIEAEAHAGEILLDEAVAAHVGASLPTEDRGEVDLKGIGLHRVTVLLEPKVEPSNPNAHNNQR